MSLKGILNFLLIILFVVGCYNIVTGKVEGTSRIVLIVVLVAIFIYILSGSSLFSSSSTLVKSITSATTHTTIEKDDLSTSKGNFSYSCWFYVDDWNYKYGERKQLLARPDNNKGFNPLIFFHPLQNDLEILVSCYSTTPTPPPPPGSDSSSTSSQPASTESSSTCSNDSSSSGSTSTVKPGPSPGSQDFICSIKNINLQKWVNLIVVLNNRTLDVYLNGKLAKTCMLPGVPRINNDTDVQITAGNNPNDMDTNAGFSGYTSNIKFFPYDLTPEDAYNVYKEGFGGSVFGSLLNRYNIKFTFYKDDVETAQVNLL